MVQWQDPSTEAELLVEAMGTLMTLTVPDREWQSAVAEHALPAWLARHLIVGQAADDVILEAVMLIATLCNSSTAQDLADSGLVRDLRQRGQQQQPCICLITRDQMCVVYLLVILCMWYIYIQTDSVRMQTSLDVPQCDCRHALCVPWSHLALGLQLCDNNSPVCTCAGAIVDITAGRQEGR